MKKTKSFLLIGIILLLLLSAVGTYILLTPQGNRPGGRPAPITYESGNGYTAENQGYQEWYSTLMEDWQSEYSTGTDGWDDPVNLLVLGLDEEGTRSDVILLLNFDPAASRLNILSVARDTMVLTNGRYNKVNALYSKGGERLLASKITQLTGLPVHYYLTVDFAGFRKIVDALGGVTFNVPFRMNYDDPSQNLHIHLKKGVQLLDGSKAEQLVRYRKGNYRGQGYIDGDIGRIRMQQDFIKALLAQKLSFRYLSRADELFGLLQKYVKTNVTLSDITQFLGSIRQVKEDEIQAFTLPGDSSMIDGTWYFILDRKEARKIIRESFYK